MIYLFGSKGGLCLRKFFTIKILILIIALLLGFVVVCNNNNNKDNNNNNSVKETSKQQYTEEEIDELLIKEMKEITIVKDNISTAATVEQPQTEELKETYDYILEEDENFLIEENYIEYEEIIYEDTNTEVVFEEIILEPQNTSNDVYTLAYELYGFNEYDVVGCLKIISYEGYGIYGEWNLSYYCACATICCAMRGDVYQQFGGADAFYTASNFTNVTIFDWAYSSFREALENLTYVYEINGIRSDYQNAIYDSWCNGYHFGVWQN